MKKKHNIKIKTPEEVAILREGGKILASIIKELKSSLKSGLTTKEIDLIAERLILRNNVIPAFKGYRGFPACACISVNEEVVHGIPGSRVVKDGDIVSVDVGIIYKEYYSDTAITLGVGALAPDRQKLLDVTRNALHKGIEQAVPGNRLSDISHAIEQNIKPHGFAIVRDFVGHGIGKHLHEDPEIPNYGPPNQGPVLEQGMVFAIEPMVNLGTERTTILSDGWTVTTNDGQPSAHFEHSIVITEGKPEILTECDG